MKNKNKLLLYLSFLMIGCFLFSIEPQTSLDSTETKYKNLTDINKDDEDVTLDINNPKTAGFWSLHPLHIDDSGGSGNGTWSWAEGKPWCTKIGNVYVIENVTIDATGNPVGILIGNSSVQFTIRNCIVYKAMGGAGILLDNTYNGTLIDNNCSFTGAGFGIYLQQSHSNNITRNDLHNNGAAGLYLYESDNNTILENNIYNTTWSGPALHLSDSDNNKILKNNVFNNSGEAIELDDSNNNTIWKNVIYENDAEGIYLFQSINNSIWENTIYENKDEAVLLEDSDSNLITLNNIFNNGQDSINEAGTSSGNKIGLNFINNAFTPITIDATGIGGFTWGETSFLGICSGNGSIAKPYVFEDYVINASSSGSGIGILDSSVYFIIRNCTVFKASGGMGILLDDTYNGTLIGNNCSFTSAGYGIYLQRSHSNNITGNDLHNNGAAGIALSESDNNIIWENNIYNTTWSGPAIDLSDSDNSKIFRNNIYNNSGYAIGLVDSNFNNLVLNELIDNDQNLIIVSGTSQDNVFALNFISDSYTPVSIDEAGNGDLTWEEASFYGICTGNGSNVNPYIIENYTINGVSMGYGILINNSISVHFEIMNCTVFGSGVKGIILENTSNGTVIGNNCTDTPAGFGYQLINSHNNLISRNRGGSLQLIMSENNIISNNTVDRIELIYSNYTSITGNKAKFGGIDMTFSYFNNITLNRLDDTNWAIYLINSNNTIITMNTLNGNLECIKQDNCENNLIALNICNGTYTPLIIDEMGLIPKSLTWALVAKFPWCSGMGTKNNPYIIKDIIFNATGVPYGVLINNSINVYFSIENWKVFNATEAGIKLENTFFGTIINNNCSFNKASGISLYNSNNITISGNVASFNIKYGIFLNMSHNNTITDNTASNNTIHGLYLLNSNNNTIFGNTETLNYNNICGIFLEFSDWNEITGNTANYNRLYGICLNSSDYNKVIGNTFIGNKIPYFQDENCEGNSFANNKIKEEVSVVVSEGDDDDDNDEIVLEIPTILIIIIGLIAIIAIIILLVKLTRNR